MHVAERIQAHLRRAEVAPPDANTQYTMPSFRVGGAVRPSLACTTVADILSLVGWKCAGVVQRCVGATPPHLPRREEEAGETRTCVHGNERVARIARLRKPVRSFSSKSPLRQDMRSL